MQSFLAQYKAVVFYTLFVVVCSFSLKNGEILHFDLDLFSAGAIFTIYTVLLHGLTVLAVWIRAQNKFGKISSNLILLGLIAIDLAYAMAFGMIQFSILEQIDFNLSTLMIAFTAHTIWLPWYYKQRLTSSISSK